MKNIFKYTINIILFIIFAFLILYKPNYIIYSPGGIHSVKEYYKIDEENKINGSINLTYVSSVRPNLVYFLYAKLRGYEIEKMKDTIYEDYKTEEYVSNLLYISSIDNAIYNAYKMAGRDVKIDNQKIFVHYNINDKSPLKPGDQILEINDEQLKEYLDVNRIINSTNDKKVKVKYLHEGKEFTKNIQIQTINNNRYLGVSLIDIFDYETDPEIKFFISDNVSGPSGGAMIALSIYTSLIDKDIVKGRKIAGTGTINRKGYIGEIGGIDFKVKSAIKAHVDIFFVPKDNYDEILKMDLDYKDTKVIPVTTFNEIIDYLESNKK